MKKSKKATIEDKMSAFCREMMEELAEKSEGDYDALMTAWREMHTIYNAVTAEILQQWADEYTFDDGEVVDVLEANEAVVEFWDRNTGKLFRRNLPINCMETANGIVLTGETMEGQPSKIAFLSETALQKIHDLIGKGADAPHHEH
ncbi:MAG: hypothetical protein AAGU23_04275 [Bacillota bacterium]|nr:hypothetical protein [Bacillota bacterium]HWR56765.1 hypothetical protein [Negativicutes bacterium]